MIITNQLDASQAADVASLEALCKENENLKGSIFLSNELNFDSNFPCFYLLYHPKHPSMLIAFLSLFVPLSTEAELYAYTAPKYRNKGCFRKLLRRALLVLRNYKIRDLLFVYEPNARCFSSVLKHLDAVYQHSEYLMTLHQPCPDNTCLPKGLSLLSASKEDLKKLATLHAAAYHLTKKSSLNLLSDIFESKYTYARKLIIDRQNLLVGICFFTIGKKELSIFSIAIHPAHQKKGYALAMLSTLFKELTTSYPKLPITLEVNSRNFPACMLYKKLGFEITSQVDYSYVDREHLLKKITPKV